MSTLNNIYKVILIYYYFNEMNNFINIIIIETIIIYELNLNTFKAPSFGMEVQKLFIPNEIILYPEVILIFYL